MVEPAQWYSLISLASSSLALLTSAYVVRKIPNRRAGDTFVMAMVFFVLAGTLAYLLRTSSIDDERRQLWNRSPTSVRCQTAS